MKEVRSEHRVMKILKGEYGLCSYLVSPERNRLVYVEKECGTYSIGDIIEIIEYVPREE